MIIEIATRSFIFSTSGSRWLSLMIFSVDQIFGIKDELEFLYENH